MYSRKPLLGSKQVSEPSDIKDNFYKQQGPTGLAKKFGWVFFCFFFKFNLIYFFIQQVVISYPFYTY